MLLLIQNQVCQNGDYSPTIEVTDRPDCSFYDQHSTPNIQEYISVSKSVSQTVIHVCEQKDLEGNSEVRFPFPILSDADIRLLIEMKKLKQWKYYLLPQS